MTKTHAHSALQKEKQVNMQSPFENCRQSTLLVTLHIFQENDFGRLHSMHNTCAAAHFLLLASQKTLILVNC